MKSVPRLKRKLVRNIFGLLSFTTALFIFQACYGMPQDFNDSELYIEGIVKSESDDTPIEGIEVIYNNAYNVAYTDSEGKFSLYLYEEESVALLFHDMDSTLNGRYADKDTTVFIEAGQDSLYLEVKLASLQ